jgi:hypothetical protein
MMITVVCQGNGSLQNVRSHSVLYCFSRKIKTE